MLEQEPLETDSKHRDSWQDSLCPCTPGLPTCARASRSYSPRGSRAPADPLLLGGKSQPLDIQRGKRLLVDSFPVLK